MNEKFYICRGATGNWSYLTTNYGWGKRFADAKEFISRDAALTLLHGRSGSIWSESELKESPYYQSEMKSAPQKTVAVEVLKPAKLANVANLQGGGDAAAAKQLNKLFTDAQNGMRRVVALGLFAWELKETKLKHGEFGPWLAKHCPKLASIHSATGRAQPSRALSGYMDLTKSVLESVGCNTLEKYFATIAKSANDADLGGGKMLLIADKKVPENLREIRTKIFELVDGKTQRSLFLEFKQMEVNADGDLRVKRGRLKGQGGATKAQRATAEELQREERIKEKRLRAQETAEWLLVMSDDAGLGEISGTPELAQLDGAMETARGYIKHHGGAK